MKKITTAILSAALIFSLSVPAMATDQTLKEQVEQSQGQEQTTTQEQTTQIEIPKSGSVNSGITSFSDVPTSHWAYDAIMKMVNKGLFSGTTTPVNGVGTFAPDKTMSRAEFVVVVVRALYKSELDAMPATEGDSWYTNAYEVAKEHGILLENELDGGNLSSPMTRQEMSMVLTRACEKIGETKGQQVKSAAIPDYNSIGTYYRDYVIQAYSKGMLCGTDTNGTFNPMGTLNRATAATVLYRLVEPSSRQEVDFNKEAPVSNQGQVQTWNEGEVHSMPKVGDTVVKSDGTKVVLKEGIAGVLGAGQGVDIWTGVKLDNGKLIKEGVVVGDIDQTPFMKDKITGEMHTDNDWIKIMGATNPTGQVVGEYEGERYNTWWEWTNKLPGGAWFWVGPAAG